MPASAHRCSWTTLCDLLEQQARALHDLHDSMRRKRTAYIAARPSELEQSMQQLEQIASSVQVLDTQRDRCVRGLATQLRCTKAQPRLRDLLDIAPRTMRTKLARAGKSIDDAARAIQVESRVGTRLLESSRQVQQGLVDAMSGAAAREDTVGAHAYGPDARYGGPATIRAATSGRLVSGMV